MAALATDIVANAVGRLWTAVVSFAIVPFYIHSLGVEGWAVVGLSLSLQAMLTVLDMGLSYTLTRELALRTDAHTASPESASLLVTFERVYWATGIVVAVALMLLADVLVSVLAAENLSADQVRDATMIFAAGFAMQWPGTLYQAALVGLRRQVTLNIILATAATVKAVGAVLVLELVSGTLAAFFAWSALTALASTLVLRAFARRQDDERRTGRFRVELLTRSWRYSAQITAILVAMAVFTQLDKLAIVSMLSLEQAGYYVLATTAASVLAFIPGPIATAVYPRLVNHHQNGDTQQLVRSYRQGTQAVACLLLPAAATMSVFAFGLLRFWTRQEEVAAAAAPFLGVLAVSAAFAGLAQIPFNFQAAVGRNGPVIAIYVASLAVAMLGIPLVGHLSGNTGIAWLWMAIHAFQLLVALPLIQSRVLPSLGLSRLLSDVLVPFLTSFAVALFVHWITRENGGGPLVLVWSFLAFVGGVLVTWPFLREIRKVVYRYVPTVFRNEDRGHA